MGSTPRSRHGVVGGNVLGRPARPLPWRAHARRASALVLAMLLAHAAGSHAAETVAALTAASDTFLSPRGKPKGRKRLIQADATLTPLLRFDLASIPSSALVRAAKLRLF